VAQVRCADGRVLDVRPVAVLDRTRTPYETTLVLTLDGGPFGSVGERCSGALQALSDRLRGGDEPAGTAERGVRAWARDRGEDEDAAWRGLRPHLPRDAELLSLRARDPDDVPSGGELRLVLGHARTWDDDDGWRSRVEVVLQAWGDGGTGVRAVLDLAGLHALLDALLAECAVALGRDRA
jgi:hypothetical protein